MSNNIEEICRNCSYGRPGNPDEKASLRGLFAGLASGTESNPDFMPELADLADSMLNIGGFEETMWVCEHPKVSMYRNNGPADGFCFTTWQETDPKGGVDIFKTGFEKK